MNREAGKDDFPRSGFKATSKGIWPPSILKDWPRDQQGHRHVPGSAIVQGLVDLAADHTARPVSMT